LFYKIIIVTAGLVGASSLAYGLLNIATATTHEVAQKPKGQNVIEGVPPDTATSETSLDTPEGELLTEIEPLSATIHKVKRQATKTVSIHEAKIDTSADKETNVFTVPFYSQFSDISMASWRKVGCGIASLAMLIEFYKPGEVTVDTLLGEGISAGAYISSAGWSHKGLIGLSNKYGLDGESYDMAGSSMDVAFAKLKDVLKTGPVIVSVHYTFDPKNPIPHLVVVNGIKDDLVHYNDPAEKSGDGTVSISQFQSAWKKRYIEVRPVV